MDIILCWLTIDMSGMSERPNNAMIAVFINILQESYFA